MSYQNLDIKFIHGIYQYTTLSMTEMSGQCGMNNVLVFSTFLTTYCDGFAVYGHVQASFSLRGEEVMSEVTNLCQYQY